MTADSGRGGGGGVGHQGEKRPARPRRGGEHHGLRGETVRALAVDMYNPSCQSKQGILDIRPLAKLLILATTRRWTRAS